VYSTDRVFVREGPVSIVESEGEKPQELHYFLFNDMFLYCKTQLAKKATFKYRGQVDLGKCLVGELIPENEGNALLVIRLIDFYSCISNCEIGW
jgi:hypothetical protein